VTFFVVTFVSQFEANPLFKLKFCPQSYGSQGRGGSGLTHSAVIYKEHILKQKFK